MTLFSLDYSNPADRHKFYKSKAWEAKRQEILERDNYECAMCKTEGRVTTVNKATLEVDHIKELKDYPELAFDDDNLQVLCHDCHDKKHKRFRYLPRKKNKWADDERFD